MPAGTGGGAPAYGGGGFVQLEPFCWPPKYCALDDGCWYDWYAGCWYVGMDWVGFGCVTSIAEKWDLAGAHLAYYMPTRMACELEDGMHTASLSV